MKTKEEDTVEQLLSDFNEALRLTGPDFSILDRCPKPYRRELSLMNVAALAYRALAPERTARLAQ